MTKNKANEPMDDSVKVAAVGTPAANHPRECWAMKTLIAEVHSLFPETPYEVSNIDGRNTALDVSFDMSVLDSTDAKNFSDLMRLFGDPAYSADPRISEVIIEDDRALVSFRSNPRTQDSRDPFGMADAYSVLIEDDEQTESGYDWGYDLGGSL